MNSPLVVLVGPTGSGKSAALLALAAQVPELAVVVADSVQAVRGFDIGSAKPTAQERERLPHFLIDVVAPDQRYDAWRFARDAEAIVAARPQQPTVLTAGTGLYVAALVDGLTAPPPPPTLDRAALAARVRADPAAAHAQLQALDPAAAARLHRNDWRRVARAIEIAGSGSDHRPASPRAVRYLGLWAEGEDYERGLRERVDVMLAMGWEAEIEALVAAHGSELPALAAVGYAQVWDTVSGRAPRRDLAERVFRATRQYAKRQRTWFKRLPVAWHRCDRGAPPPALLRDLREAIAYNMGGG